MDVRAATKSSTRWPAGVALAALALMTWRPAEGSDGWMYTTTGRWILDHHAVPYADSMTWTFDGRPWQSNGWLFGVFLSILMTTGGFALYAAVKPLATVLIGLSVRWTALQYGADRTAAAAGMLAGPLLVLVFILERPQLATFVFTPLILGLSRRAVGDERTSWGWAALTVLAFALWANLHSGALFGLLLLAAAVGGVLLEQRVWRDDRSVARIAQSAAIVVVSGLATLATPYGIDLWRYSNHVREVSSAYASEWFPPWRQDATVAVLTLGLIVAVAAVAAWLRLWRRLDLFLPVAASLVLALQAFRNAAPLALVAASLFPAALPKHLTERIRGRADLRRVAAVAMLVIAIPIGITGIWASRDPGDTIPYDTVAALPSGCRLANDSIYGNWVLWERPDIPTSVDGRNDLYGGDLHTIYWFKTEGDQDPVLADFRAEGVDCVLAQPDSAIADALLASGWRVLAEDSAAVALVPDGQSSR